MLTLTYSIVEHKLRATTWDTGARIAEEGSKFKKHIKFTITAPERADDLAAAVTGPGNVWRKETKKQVHRKYVFDEDSRRIFEKKKLLYKCMTEAGIENIGALAERIKKTRTAIYNCINYLPYRSTTARLGCYPTAQAIGSALGWDELDIKRWYNGNL